MPNIFKRFSPFKAETYQFPDTEELISEEERQENAGEEPAEDLPPSPEDEAPAPTEPEPEPEPEPEENPISFAQIQADKILEDARLQAQRILELAQEEAQQEAGKVRKAAQDEGRQEGYAQGMAQARQEAAQLREQQAADQEAAVQQFLERAGAELDRQLDQSVDELRDLAMAIAEKVVCISLRSSGEVISRMIQTAIDKRKRREWVHIYIAECDAKLLGQAPASLVSALSALSDRVRIIPMADDESGTCIIEMPDEIVDASAATQLNNIHTLLMDAATGGGGVNLF
ncbi:MAG: F0F1 ATP synthase subunit delta [Lawsonibacter sp.]|nr:F0F1 ATP synthase subunit delta [Lawsonibacter sp.]